MIWQHSLEELNTFTVHLNKCTECIWFTSVISKTEINFLDLKIKIEGVKLVTDLYVKPIDLHDYVLYNSAHPQ